MYLKVLVDNNTFIDRYYLGEPAVSYYIEDKETKILFDTGYSNVFIKNSEKMNVDLHNIDKIVISHGHNDHTGGLQYFRNYATYKNVEIVSHPDCFYKKYFKDTYIGSPNSIEELNAKFKMSFFDSPTVISENIIYLGKIPSIVSFEVRKAIGYYEINGMKKDDYVMDDSAIVYKSPKGLFIITGCSHSGICNIIEYAKQIYNDSRIYGIIGGFHLFDLDAQLYKTIEFFKENNIRKIYPCHCISLKAKIEMGKIFDIEEVGVGLEINI